jgi:hypothetical protein
VDCLDGGIYKTAFAILAIRLVCRCTERGRDSNTLSSASRCRFLPQLAAGNAMVKELDFGKAAIISYLQWIEVLDIRLCRLIV